MSATIIEMSSRKTMSVERRASIDAEASALSDLRRARIRIAQLERNLTQAMRDSLQNFNKARDAERRLAELTEGHRGQAV